MILYGVCDLENDVLGVVEWFPIHERALQEIETMLEDEPSFAGRLAVLRLDFSRGEQELIAPASRC